MESTKASIIVNAKKHPISLVLASISIILSLVIFIKASFHQFYFGDINNEPPNYDTSGKDNFTGDYGNDAMILVNLSDRDNISTADIIKLLCSYNPYSTQQLKKITIDVKLHQQVNTQFIYVSNNNFID